MDGQDMDRHYLISCPYCGWHDTPVSFQISHPIECADKRVADARAEIERLKRALRAVLSEIEQDRWEVRPTQANIKAIVRAALGEE